MKNVHLFKIKCKIYKVNYILLYQNNILKFKVILKWM